MLETNLSYPLVVEVTLYKHNLIDSRVLSEIRRNAKLEKVSNSNKHFFVNYRYFYGMISLDMFGIITKTTFHTFVIVPDFV